jgi:phosphohistidine phosphatase
MKRLILMRHAKSDWSDLTADDHARHLNGRGNAAATAMGGWLRDQTILPDAVLCSDATRTRQTLERLNITDARISFMSVLYLAQVDTLLKVLKKQSADCILLIGHNPGVGALAEHLVRSAPAHSDFQRYPTCATLVAEFNIGSWSDLHANAATALHFKVPRDFTE